MLDIIVTKLQKNIQFILTKIWCLWKPLNKGHYISYSLFSITYQFLISVLVSLSFFFIAYEINFLIKTS